MDVIEQAVINTATCTNQNSTTCIQTLQDQLEPALSKLYDLENINRQYHFYIRGIPESVTDIQGMVEMLKDTGYPKSQIWTGQSTATPRQDRFLRDIVVKSHYYVVKEDIKRKSRTLDNRSIQGNEIQIFADISPATIQKQRSLKPLLKILAQKSVKYRWSLSFPSTVPVQGQIRMDSQASKRVNLWAFSSSLFLRNCHPNKQHIIHTHPRGLLQAAPTPLWNKTAIKEAPWLHRSKMRPKSAFLYPDDQILRKCSLLS